jgi:hypothetical protein
VAEFTVTIETDAGVAVDDDFFDRLIAVVHGDERFVAPALGLEPDSRSVTFTFNVEADSPLRAGERASELVSESLLRTRRNARGGKIATAALAAGLLLIARIVIERERGRVPA